MNRKQISGRLRGFAGSLELQTGKLVGNSNLQRRGSAKIVAARIERFAGDATAMIKSVLRRN